MQIDEKRNEDAIGHDEHFYIFTVVLCDFMVRVILRGGVLSIEAMSFSMAKRRRIVVIRRIANITYTIMARGEVADIFVSSKFYCTTFNFSLFCQHAVFIFT